MKRKISQSKRWVWIKITGAMVAVFCLAIPATGNAANTGDLNFFEQIAEKFIGTITETREIIEDTSALANLSQTGLLSMFEKVKCFFGFDCAQKENKIAENTNTEIETRIKPTTQIQDDFGENKAFSDEGSEFLDRNPIQKSAQDQINDGLGNNPLTESSMLQDRKEELKTITIVQPVKEI